MEKTIIYVIMCFTKLEEFKTETGKSGIPDFGDSYIPGFYADFEKAKESVKNNACDINETCYDYAIIEKITEGLYNPAMKDERWLFKFNYEIGEYEEIEEPDILKRTCGITMS